MRPPGCRGLEDDPDAVAHRERRVVVGVAHERVAADWIVEQDERREVGELESVVEDERGLDSAVREEDVGIQLWWEVALGRHRGGSV